MMRSDKIFSDLMKKGSYKSYDNKVYFSGPCMVGKTTLASVFIGDEIPKTWLSTNGLTLFFGRNGIDLEHKTMIPLQNKMEEQQQSIQKKDALEKLGRCEIQDSMNTYEEYITHQSSQTEEKQSYKENKEKPMIHQLEHDEESYSTQLIREDEETYLTPYTTSKMANFSYPKFMEKKNNINAYSVHQTKESIREQIMKQVRSGRYNMKIAPSDLVDFGGQRCFDLTHQLFIQYKGTFVLLFDGSEGLLVATDQPDITAIETLIHWVDSVLMCCNFGEDIMPVILFGATHKDKVPQERQESLRKDYINELTTRFNKHRHTSHIRYNDLFFMNATDPNDSEIKRLQNTLVEIALRQPTWGQMMPVAWVPLELSISDLCEQGTTILRKDELTEINQNNEDLAISSEQLEVFITKQHSLGKLMYFNQPGLNQFIVIQPTSMVNILRSFITDELFWPEDVRIENIFERLHQTSMIRKEDLYIIWSQDPFDKILPTDEHKDFAICLLIHLEVLVESKNFKNENISNHYLVPCMVKKRAPKEMMNIPNLAGRSICLSYNLKNLDIPSALAFKLIGAVTSIWSLKKTNEQLCLYFQAAVLEVDAQTDMRLFMERNCVTVCLVHNTSNDQISPDVAASIQECLTQALKGVIEFYLRTFGKYQPNYCVESMYDIEFGIICKNNDRCFISEHSLGKTQRWKCKKHGIEHDTKYLLYWIFEKSSKCCESDCSGLAAFKLDKQPSDKQLVRLAKQMNQIKFREFMIHLGFTANEVDETRSRYERNKPLEQNAMMLFTWKEKETIPDLKLKDFLPAIESIGYSQHLLCQVFGEDTSSILVLGEKKLYDTPNDDILEDLPTKMGNCVIQLGIELGLTIYDVEEVIYNNYGKMRDQIKGILTKWKHMENPKPTMFRLMTAVKECKSGGFAFLCGSLHKCQKEH